MPQFDRLGNDMSDDIADALYEEELAAHIQAEHAGVSYLDADELTGYEEHCRDEGGDMYAYCRHHPTQIVSNGMFDAPCGACEGEGEDHANWSEWKEELAASGPTCDDIFAPWNPNRYCRTPHIMECYTSQAVCAADDEIPF